MSVNEHNEIYLALGRPSGGVIPPLLFEENNTVPPAVFLTGAYVTVMIPHRPTGGPIWIRSHIVKLVEAMRIYRNDASAIQVALNGWLLSEPGRFPRTYRDVKGKVAEVYTVFLGVGYAAFTGELQ